MHELAAKVDEYARGMISGSGSTLFEELGLYYIGPVDGHNVDDLVSILKEVKSTKTTGPVLIHVVTEKGRGYPYAEKAADKYHGKQKILERSFFSERSVIICIVSEIRLQLTIMAYIQESQSLTLLLGNNRNPRLQRSRTRHTSQRH